MDGDIVVTLFRGKKRRREVGPAYVVASGQVSLSRGASRSGR